MPKDCTSLLLATLLVVVNGKDFIKFFEHLIFKIKTHIAQKQDQ